MTTASLVILIVRYGIAVLFFPASALDRILDFGTAAGQAKEVFSSTALATILILVGSSWIWSYRSASCPAWRTASPHLSWPATAP